MKRLFTVLLFAVSAIVLSISSVRCEAASYRDVIFNEIYSNTNDSVVSAWITDAILYACYTYRVDPLLATALMEAESSFDHSCVSSAGAVGFMQLMPEEAETLGVDIYDPLENIIGGVSHINNLTQTFGKYGYYGMTYAIAAYNAGSNHVFSYMNGERYKLYDETYYYVCRIAEIHSRLLEQFAS